MGYDINILRFVVAFLSVTSSNPHVCIPPRSNESKTWKTPMWCDQRTWRRATEGVRFFSPSQWCEFSVSSRHISHWVYLWWFNKLCHKVNACHKAPEWYHCQQKNILHVIFDDIWRFLMILDDTWWCLMSLQFLTRRPLQPFLEFRSLNCWWKPQFRCFYALKIRNLVVMYSTRNCQVLLLKSITFIGPPIDGTFIPTTFPYYWAFEHGSSTGVVIDWGFHWGSLWISIN